jgi:hypothetical protein
MPTPAFEKIWFDLNHAYFRSWFDATFAEVIRAGGGDVERAFQETLVKLHKDPKIRERMTSNFRAVRQDVILKGRTETEAALNESQRELDAACPAHFGNQLLRVTLNTITAPFNTVVGNFEVAQQERGEVAKAIRATTGVSVEAIKKHGLCGGENSSARQLGCR